MIYLLLAMLLCMAVFFYLLADEDLVSPCVVVPAAFAFCTGLAAIYTVEWSLTMHADSCLVIVAMVVCFEVGAFLSIRSFYGRSLPKPHEENSGFVLPWCFLLPLLLLMGIMAYLNYQELWQISRQFTNSNELGDIIGDTVHNMQMGASSRKFSRWYNYRMIFGQGAAYVCWFAMLCNLFDRRRSLLYNLRFALPMCLYIGFILFTSGRQQIVYVAIFTMVVGSVLYVRSHGFTKGAYRRIILLAVGAFLGFVALFYGMGMLSGKIDESKTVLRVLAHYAGTNITAFDYFLYHLPIPESEYIGTMTLLDVYAKLGKFLPGLPETHGYIKEFVQYDLISTNTYTALRRYIQDYGFVGCGIIMFLLGTLYQTLHNIIKYSQRRSFLLLAYGLFCYPFFLLCREERFLTSVVSFNTLYLLLTAYIFYRSLLYLKRKEVING